MVSGIKVRTCVSASRNITLLSKQSTPLPSIKHHKSDSTKGKKYIYNISLGRSRQLPHFGYITNTFPLSSVAILFL